MKLVTIQLRSPLTGYARSLIALSESRASKRLSATIKRKGFDCKVIRRLIRERKMEPADLEEIETLLDTYRRALGPYIDTALGQAAMEQAAAH